MSLRVLHPGAYSILVDEGRPRTRSLGVPVGGAADRCSWQFGNALLGNPPNALALEIALSGPRLRAESSVGCVVLGAPFEIWRNATPIEPNKTFTLHVNDELAIGGTRVGLRAYLCVCGGFSNPNILHSQSGLEPIRINETLACSSSQIGGRFFRPATFEPFESLHRSLEVEPVALRMTAGLQRDWFEGEAFSAHAFQISPSSNRMGVRLQGTTLPVPEREMVSEPVCPGSIQVTRDGQCIVLGVDGQTIGGYPKIGQIITPDLDRLAQLRPGQTLRFREVTVEEARTILMEYHAEREKMVLRVRSSLDATLTRRTLLEDVPIPAKSATPVSES